MKKRLKMLLAALGVTALVVSQNGVFQVFAEEDADGENSVVVEETTLDEAVNDVVKESAPLAAATELEWHNDVEFGYATFKIPNDKGTAYYKVDIWCNDEHLATYTNKAYGDYDKDEVVELFLLHFMNKSGKYKFQVTTLDTEGNPKTQRYSEEYDCIISDTKLSVPENISWNKDGIFSCSNPNGSNVLQYCFYVYAPNGSQSPMFGSPYVAGLVAVTENENGITFNLNEYLRKQYGISSVDGFSVTVQATSNDKAAYGDSDFSDRIWFSNEPEQAESDNGSSQTVADNSSSQSTADNGSSQSTADNSSSQSTADNGSSHSVSSTVEVKEWKPTTPDEKKRYEVYGKEKVVYTADNGNAYSVTIHNAMQGKKCFDSFEAVLMDWKIGRTYNIFPSGKIAYKMNEKTRITLSIPQALQAAGREFKMVCVTQNGQPIILDDLDSDPNTITFETDTYYAFALVYKNN